MASSNSDQPLLKRLLREPLLHFLLLGVTLFTVNHYLELGRGGPAPSRQIQLTLDDLRQLDLLFQSQWRRPPTPEELARLVESKIQEEVLYREGLAMGLDRDDTIVKRRMAQKMRFLAEDVAGASPPTTAELKAWYEKHPDTFAQPARLSFRHVYFSPDRRGGRAHADAVQALTRLGGQPEDSKVAASLADPFMLQDYYADRTPEQLAKEFGPAFAQAVSGLAPGSWQGPVESGYGWHLVFVHSVIPGRVPAFEEIEPDVKTAWLTDQKQQGWQKSYDAMRAKYTVFLPAPPDQPSAHASAPSNERSR
ncbi:MAG TPA: peptidylprolyl isomerase [Burkholderiales bacterium]